MSALLDALTFLIWVFAIVYLVGTAIGLLIFFGPWRRRR